MDPGSRRLVDGDSTSEFSGGGFQGAKAAEEIGPQQTNSASAELPSGSGFVPHDPPAIPDHELLQCIGRGGYGEVWLARNVFGTHRAVKIVHRGAFANERPFEREFTGIQKFEPISRSHDSQVDILHIGRNDHCFYYVMELADNAGPDQTRVGSEAGRCQGDKTSDASQTENLRKRQTPVLEIPPVGVSHPSWGTGTSPQLQAPSDYVPRTLKLELSRHGNLPVSECIEIGISLTTALAHLHKHGLVHRDVKPSNVIFVNGVPKLADIGLVTGFDATISCVGTVGFLPVEGPGTPQADLYALGKLLYEISSGKDRLDYPEPTLLTELPDRQQFLELGEIIKKACARSSADRYQSAEAMQADLLLLKAGKSVRQAHNLERRLKLMTRIAIGITAALVLGVVPYWLAIKEARHARLAEADANDKLWNLYRSQARASRYGHPVGWRFEALDYLKKAAQMRPSLDLRNEAIAYLAAPDLHLIKQWDGLLVPCGTVDFDFEHRRYVRSDSQGGLSIRSLENDREQFPLSGSGAPASSELAFSPSGRYLLAGYAPGFDGYSCKVWDLETHQAVLSLTNFLFRGGTFSPDEATIALGQGIEPTAPGTHQTGIIHLYDLAAHAESWSIPVPLLPYDVRFGPTGGRVAVSVGGKTVLLLDTISGKVVCKLEAPDNIRTLACPDGKRLAGAAGDARVYVWDWETTNRPTESFVGHDVAVMNVQYSSDGNWLASAAWDGTFRLWDSLSKKQILSAPLTATFFRHSRDGRLWGHQLGGKRLGIWEAATEREVCNLRNIATPQALAKCSAVSPGTELLAVGYEKDGVRIWNLHSHRAVAWLPIGTTYDLKFAGPGGDQLFTCTDTGLQEWPLAVNGDDKLTLGQARQISRSGAVLNLSFDQLGRSACIQNGKVHMFDAAYYESQPPVAAAFPFNQVATSFDGTLIAAWGWPANEFQIWNRLEHRLVKTFPGVGGGQAALSQDGQYFAFGDGHGYQVVRVGSWAPLLSIRKETDFQLYALAFSPNGNLLAISCAPATVILLDTQTWREVARLEAPEPRPVVALNFTSDSSRLIATCNAQTVQVWDLSLIRRELATMHLDWDLPPYPDLVEEENSLSVAALPTSIGR
jgi:WD40 repeat protein/serine/threonine protein kinase